MPAVNYIYSKPSETFTINQFIACQSDYEASYYNFSFIDTINYDYMNETIHYAAYNIISDYFLTCFSYYDLSSEKIYQIIMVTLLASMFDECIVKSEVNEGLGRCDIFLRSKNNNDLAIVIEIKRLASYKTETILNNSALTALKQIKKKNYLEEALKLKSKKIIAYGIAFTGKHSKVVKERIN